MFRTDLITDRDVLAAVDAQLAVAAPRRPSMTRGRLAGLVDRGSWPGPTPMRCAGAATPFRTARSGLVTASTASRRSSGTLFTTDAHAVGKRLAALAATVCDRDRAPASSAAPTRSVHWPPVRTGWAAIAGNRTVPPAVRRPEPVLIHVVAEQSTVNGTGQAPASMVGADGLIPPEMLAELAKSAKLLPLIHPADAPPEPGYVPSKALADFVRCRDLTCRFPECDQPAMACDLDHAIAFSDGGRTHAGNLKCLCRTHHLVKTFWGWRDKQLPDGTGIGVRYPHDERLLPAPIPRPRRNQARRRPASAKTCSNCATASGWDSPVEYCDDNVSATKGRRPDYERLCADIADGVVKRVAVWEMDRLHRSPPS